MATYDSAKINGMYEDTIISQATYVNCWFDGFIAKNVTFDNCVFKGAIFSNVFTSDVTFTGCKFSDCVAIKWNDIEHLKFLLCEFKGVQFLAHNNTFNKVELELCHLYHVGIDATIHDFTAKNCELKAVSVNNSVLYIV